MHDDLVIMSNFIQTLEERNDELRMQRQEQDSVQKELQNQVENLKTQLQKSATEESKEISRMHAELDSVNDQLHSVEKKFREKQNDYLNQLSNIEHLNKTVSQRESQIAQLDAQLAQAQEFQQRSELLIKRTQKEKMELAQAFEAKVEEMNALIATRDNDLAESSSRVQQLLLNLETSLDDKKKQDEEITSTRRRLKRLVETETKLQQLQDQIKQVTDDKQMVQKDKQAELQRQEYAALQLNILLEAKDKEIDALRTQLDNGASNDSHLHETMNALEEKLQAASLKNEMLENEAKELHMKLELLKTDGIDTQKMYEQAITELQNDNGRLAVFKINAGRDSNARYEGSETFDRL
jgi:chromosome segregation ATPase